VPTYLGGRNARNDLVAFIGSRLYTRLPPEAYLRNSIRKSEAPIHPSLVSVDRQCQSPSNVVQLTSANLVFKSQSVPRGTQPNLVFVRSDGQLVSGYCDVSWWLLSHYVPATPGQLLISRLTGKGPHSTNKPAMSKLRCPFNSRT
jgi:hypothetical protein